MNRRASNLTESLERKVVVVINSFSEKISWSAVIKEIERQLGERYTEQGLRKHSDIADAFRVKKMLLAKESALSANKKVRSATAKRILELEAENATLKEINNRLMERFAVWAHNAAGHKLTESDLSEPIELYSTK